MFIYTPNRLENDVITVQKHPTLYYIGKGIETHNQGGLTINIAPNRLENRIIPL